MPKNNSPVERYRRIHEIFSRSRGGDAVVKLQDLADTLGISLRQLNDDIKYLREEGAPLEYLPALRGWRYAEGRDFAMVDDQLLTDDDVLNILALVTDTLEDNGRPTVKLDVYLENERGERPVQGTAIVELPKRG